MNLAQRIAGRRRGTPDRRHDVRQIGDIHRLSRRLRRGLETTWRRCLLLLLEDTCFPKHFHKSQRVIRGGRGGGGGGRRGKRRSRREGALRKQSLEQLLR